MHSDDAPILPRVIASSFSLSADGFGAGPGQDLANPMGVGGMQLHAWVLATRTFQASHGGEGGETGTVDDGYAARGMAGMGAWILGRNMFGPMRGAWQDSAWRGWWGDDPPYHCPVFVLTHFPRQSIEMSGGTTFHFVADGSRVALERARAAAGDRDIRIGGGVATLRGYLRDGSIDEMHLAVAPVLLGRGESLWDGLDLPALGYGVDSSEQGERATHLMIRRR